MGESENSLWVEVGNVCLSNAKDLLKKETRPTAETVALVDKLVQIAVVIDQLNLAWDNQNRCGAVGLLDQSWAQR